MANKNTPKKRQTRTHRDPQDEHEQREQARWAFEWIESQPTEDAVHAPSRRSQSEIEAGAWAARLLMLWTLGINSRAGTLPEFEVEWGARLALLPQDPRALIYDVRSRRAALRASWAEHAAGWAGRVLGGTPTLFPISLPEFLEETRFDWGRFLDEHLARRADEHRRVTSLLRSGASLERAAMVVTARGGDRLSRVLLSQTPDAQDGAKHPDSWWCRLCGDHGCVAHCTTRLGRHQAEVREGEVVCKRCGRVGRGTEVASVWPCTEGDPQSWASRRPRTAEELADDEQRRAIEDWISSLEES